MRFTIRKKKDSAKLIISYLLIFGQTGPLRDKISGIILKAQAASIHKFFHPLHATVGNSKVF